MTCALLLPWPRVAALALGRRFGACAWGLGDAAAARLKVEQGDELEIDWIGRDHRKPRDADGQCDRERVDGRELHGDYQDRREDRQELLRDKRDRRQDVRDLRPDRRELRRDVADRRGR